MPLEALEPSTENSCIGCGAANPRGLRLRFDLDREAQRVYGRFLLGLDYAGSSGMLHGGVIALVLDEAMGKLTRLFQVRAVTAELQIEYLRPVPADQEFLAEAGVTAHEGRNLLFEGELRSQEGKVLARGRGRFVAIGPR